MIPFVTPPSGCVPVLSYLDPPIGAGVQRLPTDANRIITRNGQFFPLADQGTDGLKNFANNISVCHGITPQHVRQWYHTFVQHSSGCGLYAHPYYCFRPSAPSLLGFTCGFDKPAVVGVTGSPLIAATTGSAAIQAAHGVAFQDAVLPTLEIPAVIEVTAADMQQYDLPGHL